jgi:hypothetical protein
VWGRHGFTQGSFGGENLRRRDHFKELGVDERIILKQTFRNRTRTWDGLLWLRTGTGDGLL